MHRETIVALLNYQWLVKNPHSEDAGPGWDGGLRLDIDTVMRGNGGFTATSLIEPGSTPATEDPAYIDDLVLKLNGGTAA